MRRIVAVGSGPAVRGHTERYARFDDAVLVGVVGGDPTAEGDDSTAEGGGVEDDGDRDGDGDVERYESVAQALESAAIDGVDVCGPGAAHGDAVDAALDADVPVRCDPPFALDETRLDRLVSRAAASDGWLLTASPHRHSRLYGHLRSAVEAGDIGSVGVARIKRTAPFEPVGWNCSYAGVAAAPTPIDALCSVLAHDADVLEWTFGTVGRVFARAQTDARTDHAHAVLSFRDGGRATVEATWSGACTPEPRLEVEYSGDHGRLDFDEHDASTALRNGGGAKRVDPPEDDCRGRLLRAFVERLGEEPSSVPGVHPEHPSRVAAAVRRSVDEGRPVALAEESL
ncbi:Gfo/Idh/MocA family protein [Halogeometricum limi]|uniref:Predicted dehydrogenase n=1 Tax=Halogeometricum limi TaxID=555875 RepID=A0A1I6IBM4_9EURY|nr:Gfo/Idh/MocA family oxidoreductase [Halogeometricum limi]SFR64147.1 Predicted dehydrogenase [Halogeometricum limi]